MALTQRLEIRQGQSLVMTPQLQQAIKLLQLSNFELAEYGEGGAREESAAGTRRARTARQRRARGGAGCQRRHDEPLDQHLAREDFSKAADLDADRSDVYAEDDGAGRRSAGCAAHRLDQLRSAAPVDGDDDGLRSHARRRPPSLKDHLLEQLSIAAVSAEHRLIAACADRCDRRSGLSARRHRRCGRAAWAPLRPPWPKCSRSMQGFDPAGVGARDLAECLVAAAARAGPPRSGHAGVADPARSCGAPRHSASSVRSAVWTPKTSPT